MALVSCSEPAQPLTIDNALTAEEIAAARLTPEVMWKMRRIGSAEEVARTISFLCGEGAAFITGQVLGVDGGYL